MVVSIDRERSKKKHEYLLELMDTEDPPGIFAMGTRLLSVTGAVSRISTKVSRSHVYNKRGRPTL